MRVAVVGGTGLIGRKVVDVLRADGLDVVVVSRRGGVDVTTGDGLDDALSGVQRVIDVTNSPSNEEGAATAFFVGAAAHLQRVGERAGVHRLVVLSIAGIDRLSSGYYVAKRRQEEAIRSGAVPVVIARATQFHEFAGQVLECIQEMLVQPVAADTVARQLRDLTLADETTEICAIAGPQVEELVDMVRRLVAKRGDTVRLEAFRQPDADGEAVATGALLPGPGAVIAGPTFQRWLEGQPIGSSA